MCFAIKSIATEFWPPAQGMMISAFLFDGDTYASNIGFTNVVYCKITPSTCLPRSNVSLFILLAKRKSSSVSTKIFMWHKSLTASIANTKIPSMIITSPGSTLISTPSFLECVTKSYTGTFTFLLNSKSFSVFTIKGHSIASGWSKLYCFTFRLSSSVKGR